MKYILLLLISLSLTFATTKIATIHVQGMTCPLCTMAIKKSLKKIDGVNKAKVILNTKQATVYFDDKKVSKDDLLQAVKNAGYTGKIESIKGK